MLIEHSKGYLVAGNQHGKRKLHGAKRPTGSWLGRRLCRQIICLTRPDVVRPVQVQVQVHVQEPTADSVRGMPVAAQDGQHESCEKGDPTCTCTYIHTRRE